MVTALRTAEPVTPWLRLTAILRLGVIDPVVPKILLWKMEFLTEECRETKVSSASRGLPKTHVFENRRMKTSTKSI